jgi:redox-sensitive bicupin YhaK (pirin superfamily)
MSDLASVDAESPIHGAGDGADVAVAERTPWRSAEIAPGVSVERALPLRKRRTVGAWCFLDLAGPFDPARSIPMDVGPHPHIGLQTVTWMLDGQAVHRDSLGSEQLIRPQQLNLMTSGAGIAHSEHATPEVVNNVQLAQLWVALPEAVREGASSFTHHPELPLVDHQGLATTVLVGEHDGSSSPARMHTGIIGLDLHAPEALATRLPLDGDFEHAAVVLSGSVELAGERLERGELLYLGRHRRELAVETSSDARFLILGGEPFGADILMWWNFVARSRHEIEAARSDWMRDAGLEEGGPTGRFLPVPGDDGPPIPAPALPWTLHS